MTQEDNKRRRITVGDYVVTEAGMRESIRRSNMVGSVQRYIEAHPDDNELTDFLYVYPFVAGCITPILSIEQFMDLPESVVEELSKAAMDVNPHWFVVPDAEKKTNEPQSESISNSES